MSKHLHSPARTGWVGSFSPCLVARSRNYVVFESFHIRRGFDCWPTMLVATIPILQLSYHIAFCMAFPLYKENISVDFQDALPQQIRNSRYLSSLNCLVTVQQELPIPIWKSFSLLKSIPEDPWWHSRCLVTQP